MQILIIHYLILTVTNLHIHEFSTNMKYDLDSVLDFETMAVNRHIKSLT